MQVLERETFNWNTHVKIQKFHASDIADAVRDGDVPGRQRRYGLFLPESQRIAKGVQRATLADMEFAGLAPYEVVEMEHNLLVNGGINTMLKLLTANGGTAYANGVARVCVGDGGGSVPTPAATDTTLAATSNRYNQACDATFPSVSGQTASFQATFPIGQGNFVWNEWGVDGGGASGAGAATGLLNHRGVNLGTKTSAAAWAFTGTITIS